MRKETKSKEERRHKNDMYPQNPKYCCYMGQFLVIRLEWQRDNGRGSSRAANGLNLNVDKRVVFVG